MKNKSGNPEEEHGVETPQPPQVIDPTAPPDKQSKKPDSKQQGNKKRKSNAQQGDESKKDKNRDSASRKDRGLSPNEEL